MPITEDQVKTALKAKLISGEITRDQAVAKMAKFRSMPTNMKEIKQGNLRSAEFTAGQRVEMATGAPVASTIDNTAELVSNIPDSARQLYNSYADIFTSVGEGIKNAYNDPYGTAEGAMGKVGDIASVGRALAEKGMRSVGIEITDEQSPEAIEREELANKITQAIDDNFGTLDNLNEFVVKNPLQAAEMVSGLATGATFLKGGKAALGASKAKTLSTIADVADPITGSMKAAGKVGELTGINKLIGKATDKGAELFGALAVKDAKANKIKQYVDNHGVPPGKVAAEFGISGDASQMAEQAFSKGMKSKNVVDDQLMKIKAKYKDDILEVGNEQLGTINSLLNKTKKQFNSKGIREEIDFFGSLKGKLNKGGLDLSELNEVQRKFTDLTDAYKLGGEVKAAKKGIAQGRSDMRSFLIAKAKENGVMNLAEMNAETSKLIQLGDLMSKTNTVTGRTRVFEGLKKILVSGAASSGTIGLPDLIGVSPGAMFGFGLVAQVAADSPKLTSFMAKQFQKISPGGIKALQSAMYNRTLTPQANYELTKIVKAAKRAGINIQLVKEENERIKEFKKKKTKLNTKSMQREKKEK
jgi:hypothetical protein